MPEVSVIVPTCDRPWLALRAVRSVLRQTHSDLEVIVVDNNRRMPRLSENGEFATLQTDPRVRLIEATAAHNAASARNFGLAAAAGDWMTFLDDDDEYHAEKVAAQLACARMSGAPLVLCGYELVWPHFRRVRQVDRDQFVGDEMLTHTLLGTPALFHFRTDPVRFDPSLDAGEDMVYALELIRWHKLRKLPCVPRPLVFVTQQTAGGSVHRNKEAVWRTYEFSARLLIDQFSPAAKLAYLARGRLERARGGHGGLPYFLGSLLEIMRTPTPRKWRVIAFALRERFRADP